MSSQVPAPDAAALPAGARDTLPTEAAELREIIDRLREAFVLYGYREIETPVLEFADVLDRVSPGVSSGAYRLFDDAGRVLVLRPDLTIPVARLIATRLADREAPVRVHYVGRAFRPPPPGRPEAAEQRQAGIELVGEAGPDGDAEVIAVLVRALRAAGLGDLSIGLGDVGLTDAVLDASGVPGDARSALRATAATRDLVGWRDAVDGLELAPERRRLVADLLSLRGGPEVLREIRDAAPEAAAACRRVEHVLESLGRREVECSTLIDLSVLRDWPYYSGIVFEAYTPAVSAPVAMGGRYDRLAARFGRDRPAVGFGIALQPLNRALVQQNGGTMALLEGVVLAGGLEDQAKAADEARAAGIVVVAAADRDAAERAAEADGWRYVAWRDGDAFALVDRSGGESRRVARLSEVTPSRP